MTTAFWTVLSLALTVGSMDFPNSLIHPMGIILIKCKHVGQSFPGRHRSVQMIFRSGEIQTKELMDSPGLSDLRSLQASRMDGQRTPSLPCVSH